MRVKGAPREGDGLPSNLKLKVLVLLDSVLRSAPSDSRSPECHGTVLSLPALECTLGVSLNCPAAEFGRPDRRVLENVCVEFNLTWNFLRGVLTCTQRMPIRLEGGCRLPSQVRCRVVPESPPPLVPRATAHGAYRSDTCHLSPCIPEL